MAKLKKIPGFSSKVFIFVFFFAAVQEAQQTNHFSSAHGTDRQFTFLSIRFLYLKQQQKS